MARAKSNRLWARYIQPNRRSKTTRIFIQGEGPAEYSVKGALPSFSLYIHTYIHAHVCVCIYKYISSCPLILILSFDPFRLLSFAHHIFTSSRFEFIYINTWFTSHFLSFIICIHYIHQTNRHYAIYYVVFFICHHIVMFSFIYTNCRARLCLRKISLALLTD